MKICIRYDLSIDPECKEKDYLYVTDVEESENEIHFNNKSYLKMVVKYDYKG